MWVAGDIMTAGAFLDVGTPTTAPLPRPTISSRHARPVALLLAYLSNNAPLRQFARLISASGFKEGWVP